MFLISFCGRLSFKPRKLNNYPLAFGQTHLLFIIWIPPIDLIPVGKVESVFPQTLSFAFPSLFHRFFPLLLALFSEFQLASQTLSALALALAQCGVKYLLLQFSSRPPTHFPQKESENFPPAKKSRIKFKAKQQQTNKQTQKYKGKIQIECRKNNFNSGLKFVFIFGELRGRKEKRMCLNLIEIKWKI